MHEVSLLGAPGSSVEDLGIFYSRKLHGLSSHLVFPPSDSGNVLSPVEGNL